MIEDFHLGSIDHISKTIRFVKDVEDQVLSFFQDEKKQPAENVKDYVQVIGYNGYTRRNTVHIRWACHQGGFGQKT